MRVLLVAPRYAPSTGGVETHVREIARRLPGLGIDAQVLTTDATGLLPAEDEIDGVRVRRVRAWPTGRDWLAAPGLAPAIRAARPDLVHVHSFQTLVAPVAMAVAAAGRVPALLTAHSGGRRAGIGRALPAIQLTLLAPFLRRPGAVLAVSAFESRLLARRLRIPARSIPVVPNGADLPAADPSVVVDPDLLVSIGRLEPYKGHERAIHALAARRGRGLASRLLVLGAGPDRDRLLGVAAELGVADRVEITALPGDARHALADRLASAACVLVLSAYESQGIAAWEALGLRRPLVVADGSALAELVAAGAAEGVPIDRRAGDAALDAQTIDAAIDRAIATRTDRPRVHVPTWDGTALRLAALYRARLEGDRG
jgi:glycosyltransferase involved in cell wall biosynthesis